MLVHSVPFKNPLAPSSIPSMPVKQGSTVHGLQDPLSCPELCLDSKDNTGGYLPLRLKRPSEIAPAESSSSGGTSSRGFPTKEQLAVKDCLYCSASPGKGCFPSALRWKSKLAFTLCLAPALTNREWCVDSHEIVLFKDL
ncbi:unnamed protein product [Pleuronectes platessa]|uniref:Uncharacterized protein n=1 Tax=Pleuronectes platessa TaxID=8262 RepID=A0A9N7YRU5_PLEPL|nr:unnamed protein product [Pleuronectes platessa]